MRPTAGLVAFGDVDPARGEGVQERRGQLVEHPLSEDRRVERLGRLGEDALERAERDAPVAGALGRHGSGASTDDAERRIPRDRLRDALDGAIIEWANGLDAHWLQDNLHWYSNAAKRELTRPKALVLDHFFNHQTHHRGQVHCMLTQCGVKPGDTDLPLMP